MPSQSCGLFLCCTLITEAGGVRYALSVSGGASGLVGRMNGDSLTGKPLQTWCGTNVMEEQKKNNYTHNFLQSQLTWWDQCRHNMGYGPTWNSCKAHNSSPFNGLHHEMLAGIFESEWFCGQYFYAMNAKLTNTHWNQFPSCTFFPIVLPLA